MPGDRRGMQGDARELLGGCRRDAGDAGGMAGSPVLPVLPTALCPSTTRRRVRAGLRLTERRRGRGKLIPEPGRG